MDYPRVRSKFLPYLVFTRQKDIAGEFVIDQSKDEDDAKIERIWNILEAVCKQKKMNSRFIAVILFYSSHSVNKITLQHEFGDKLSITSEDISTCINEWTNVVSLYKDGVRCICSHNIDNIYLVKNTVNGNILRIGSSCIDKFGNGLLKDVAKITRKKEDYKGDKKMCASCLNFKISNYGDEDWKIYCKYCLESKNYEVSEAYAIMNNFRKCVICEKLNISPYDPDYKVTCTQCFNKKDQDLPNCRKCEDCGFNRIPNNKEAYVTKCNECFKKSLENNRICSKCGMRSITPDESEDLMACKRCREDSDIDGGRQCVVCHRNNIPPDSKDYVTMCKSCFINTRKVQNRQCEDCHLFKIPTYKEKYIKKCIDCFKKSKM